MVSTAKMREEIVIDDLFDDSDDDRMSDLHVEHTIVAPNRTFGGVKETTIEPRGSQQKKKSPQVVEGNDKKKKRRKVTFAEQNELREYEPDVHDPEEEDAAAMDFIDEVEYRRRGISVNYAESTRNLSAVTIANSCSSSKSYRLIQQLNMQHAFATDADTLANEENPLRILCSSLIVYHLVSGCRLKMEEFDILLTTLHKIFAEGQSVHNANDEIVNSEEYFLKITGVTTAGFCQNNLSLQKFLPRSLAKKRVPAMLSLVTLSSVMKTPETEVEANQLEILKEKVLDSGLLNDLVLLLFECNQESSTPKDSNQQYVWISNKVLQILASATFLNRRNVQFIEKYVHHNENHKPCESVSCTIMSTINNQYKSKSDIGYDCIHSGLNLLVNLTHESMISCHALARADFFSNLVQIMVDYQGAVSYLGKGLSDLVSLIMGLLINIVEKDKTSRATLCEVEICHIRKREFLTFLFDLGDFNKDKDDFDKKLFKEFREEITMDMINESKSRDKSISKAYASILLGFLIAENNEAKGKVARLFGENGIQPLIDSIKGFLNFLDTANALTENQSEVLKGLIKELEG